MEFCSMLCGSLDAREVWGRMYARVCMAESLAAHLSVSQHCSSTLLLSSLPVASDSLRLCVLQRTRARFPSPPPSLSDFHWWCHPTISPSVTPFSSRLQSFPASGPFQWVGSCKVHFSKVLKNMRESTRKIPEEEVYQAEVAEQAERFRARSTSDSFRELSRVVRERRHLWLWLMRSEKSGGRGVGEALVSIGQDVRLCKVLQAVVWIWAYILSWGAILRTEW